jgi:hypothetical protein
MKFRKTISILVLSSLIAPLASAGYMYYMMANFRDVYQIEVPEIELATEVIVELPEDYELGYSILEDETGEPQATRLYTDYETLKLEVTENSVLKGNAENLTDGDHLSYAEFDLDKDDGEAYVILSAEEAFTSSSFRLSVDDNVALPYEIAIFAKEDGAWSTVVSKSEMKSAWISFPETRAQEWMVELWHAQPLHVTEMSFVDEEAAERTASAVWLARPGESYTLYTDAAVYTHVDTMEAGTLSRTDAIEATLGEREDNAIFTEPDVDKDGVINTVDNCVSVSNSDQIDLDSNGLGDACEDHDGDGVIDSVDNCPEHANRNQKDSDSDEIGDECDDEENRVTENLPWLPWAAMGIAALVVLAIVVKTVRKG